MKFPDFPAVEGYPCTDPDLFWGYACNGHVGLREFEDRCIEEFAYGTRLPTFIHDKTAGPGHAFVKWKGFGGWDFCFPDEDGVRPISFWPADTCSYTEWLSQWLKDISRSRRAGSDELALKIIHVLQEFRYDGYGPAIDALLADTQPAPCPEE